MKNNIALGENWIFSFAGPIFFYSRPPKMQYNHGIEIAGALKYDLKQFFFGFRKNPLENPVGTLKTENTHDLCTTYMHDRPFPIVADKITKTNVTWHLFFSFVDFFRPDSWLK